MALPTSGAAWDRMKAVADGSWTTPNLCDQDNKADIQALAGALVYARIGGIARQSKVIDAIGQAVASQRDGCGNAVLALGRQLGGWVIAADLVGYRDDLFVSWVKQIRTRNIGGHGRWSALRATAYDSSSNWGTFALASVTAADLYLRDALQTERDFEAFRGYGDGKYPWRHTSSYQAVWACPEGYAINPASCADPRKEGAAVEDASRTSFPTLGGYPAEAAQGYVVTAELLSVAGYPAWTVNDRQVCRNALWRERGGNLNHSSVDTYVTWLTNARCGLSQPTKPTGSGRVFSWTDWLYR